jgi:hypothetical protein
MSANEPASPAELYDAFIKSEWQDIFRTEVRVELDNGTRYVPNGGSQGVSLLRKNVNAFDEAIRLWSGPTDEPIGSSRGYDRIVDQAGIHRTWEWFLIDPSRPWAHAVPELVRERIRKDLEHRDKAALQRAEAKAAQQAREDEAEDDRMIALLNQRRSDEGKPPLTSQQEESVRAGRRDRRATGAQAANEREPERRTPG